MTRAAAPTAAELRAEIDRTRAELGETARALAAKADVRTRLGAAVRTKRRELTDRVAATFGDGTDPAAPAAGLRRYWWLIPAGAAAAALVGVLVKRRGW
ncbi:hypothetical protein GCM10010123_39200 [Pilimelia anulata]|uniref:DUF3618 domain-containing protein n=1 Tax=Pilimelia anulata TaxID=53371 RepID=A0A8J3FCC1_9ACTN|nr:DUF3618 domain-containing protein [Pilimelia anulata]GGK05474.1 hypothetical protein GCM10010123_39200 [Pilimelia anulata]